MLVLKTVDIIIAMTVVRLRNRITVIVGRGESRAGFKGATPRGAGEPGACISV